MADTSQSIKSEPKRIRSVAYYLQNVIIDVEGCLYSIPKQALMSQSPVFEGMFAGDNDGAGEGATDEKPIVLEGYKSNDFECLLKVMLPQPLERSLPVLTKGQWVGVLKLSTVWQIDRIREIAIDQVSMIDLSPIEKVLLAREYRVLKWFSEGIATLASDFSQYQIKDVANALGWETTALILSVRDRAKPKLLEGKDLLSGWICGSCNRDLSTTTDGGITCGNQCWSRLLEPRPGATNPASAGETRGFVVPQPIISAVFEEEIKVLQN
ncbi:hypothetical protein BKA70DRAFT_1280038 [Coprinopsis sp. MPI-PUGE-AT-0042]|nr:hypothetical protein BKA70DRAFT_1280038 [Coprinopsis sp. MPI-PUGE-AT-0042]